MDTGANNFGPLSWDRVEAALSESVASVEFEDAAAWTWHRTDTAIELRGRLPSVPDRRHRELMLVGGALLLNLRLLVRGLGAHVAVRIMPDPSQRNLVAVVRPEGTRPVTADDRNLLDAVLTGPDDRATQTQTVTADLLNRLRRAARLEQAWLAELPGSPDAEVVVPASDRTASGDGNHAGLGTVPIVVGTVLDGPAPRLQAGQAMQRVLLTAAARGVPARMTTSALRSSAQRQDMRALLGGGLWPQATLLLGSAASDESPIATGGLMTGGGAGTTRARASLS